MSDTTPIPRIPLAPTPRHEDDRIRIRVDRGTLSERFREASRSVARFRWIEVENHTPDWLALVASFPEGVDRVGRRVPPGGTTHVSVMYEFEREALHSPGVYMDTRGATKGLAEVHLGFHSDTTPPHHNIPEAILKQLDPARADYLFDFDIGCYDVPGRLGNT